MRMVLLYSVSFPSRTGPLESVILMLPMGTLNVTTFLRTSLPKIDFSVPTILTGDFNTVFDRSLDRSGSDPADTSRESSDHL